MNKVIYLLLTSVILIFSINTQTTTPSPPDWVPPDWLYRVDERGPDEIFQRGFIPWGDNKNLGYHASGETCARGRGDEPSDLFHTSNFISTTSIPYDAFSIMGVDAVLRAYIQDHPEGHIFYVYTINADRRFYELRRSCANYYNNNIEATQYRRQLRDILRTDSILGEWVAEGGIRSELIYSAEEFILHFEENDRSRPYFSRGNSFSNSRYVESPPRFNTNPYPHIYPSIAAAREPEATRWRTLTRIVRDFFGHAGVSAGMGGIIHSMHKRSVELDDETDHPSVSISSGAAWPAVRIKTY